MYNVKKLLGIYLETPMHPGTGSVVNSSVDLPIQREITTKFPTIQSSAIKGNLKDLVQDDKTWKNIIEDVFGKEDGRGSISITDGNLLLFPVRSLDRVFSWITCPLILQRFCRDLEIIGESIDFEIPEIDNENKALAFELDEKNNKLLLENYLFELGLVKDMDNLYKYIEALFPKHQTYNYLKIRLKRNLFILNDKIFTYIVNTETEVNPRIRMDPEKGVTEHGALFYEEYLPRDTLMYCMIQYNDTNEIDLKTRISSFDGKSLQIGGNFTIGKGFTTLRLYNDKGEVNEK